MESEKEMTYNRILVVNLGGIGDLLLSSPALRAIKQAYPNAKVSLLVIPRCREMAKTLEYIDSRYYFYKGFLPVNLFRNLKTLLILRRQKFDLLINMRTLVSLKSSLMMRLLIKVINPGKTAGRDTQGRGKFFDFKIFETDLGDRYEMEYDLETVRQLGIQVTDKSFDLKISDIDRQKAKSFLLENKSGENRFLIGINPGGELSHRWPKEKFSALIQIINEKHSCRFFVTGGAQEFALSEEIALLSKVKIINLCGRTTLSELGAWLEMASLYITNDTGPMHLAAVLKTPMVAIFGPGYLKRFDPRVISDQAFVVNQPADCSPCNRKQCFSGKCLDLIPIDEVAGLCLSLLRKKL